MSIIFRKNYLKRIQEISLSPPSRLYNIHSRTLAVHSSVLSILVRSTKLDKLDESTKERPGAVSVQCRVRACTSFPRLARARARASASEREDLSLLLPLRLASPVHTHLSLSPFFLVISVSAVYLSYVYIYIYPLLRGSFSQRINLYVYNLTTVYFPRSFFQRVWLLSARSQASPRTRRTRKLSISSLTPCSWNPFLPPDFSDYVDFQSETHMYIFQRNCEKSVIERMEESNPGVFPRRSSIGRCTRPLDKLCSAHRLLIDCLHLVSLHWRPFVEIGNEKGGEENARWSVFSHAPSFQHFRRLPPRESPIAAIPIF